MAKIKGLDKVLKKLQKFGDEAEDSVLLITRENAKEIAANAKSLAPVNFGKLQQSIGVENAEDGFKVVVNAHYGAYIEFGTGDNAKNIPSEFKEMAAKFKGRGQGSWEEGVRSLADWLQAKGGNPEDAEWILIRIMRRGIEAQPYLYPSWVKGKMQYLKDLKAELKHLTNKYD